MGGVKVIVRQPPRCFGMPKVCDNLTCEWANRCLDALTDLDFAMNLERDRRIWEMAKAVQVEGGQ